MIALLIVSSLGTLANVYVNTKHFTTDEKSSSLNVALGLTESVQDGFFLASHWILASRYNQIASEMPYVVHNVRIPLKMQACHKRIYWLLLVLIIMAAVFECVLDIRLFNQIDLKGNPTPGDAFFIAIFIVFVLGALLAFVTGCVLMRSVIKIREFYEDNDLKDELNGKFLKMHSLAFGLFMLSFIPVTISFMLVVLNPSKETYENIFHLCYIFEMLTATTSEALLCCIFWKLCENPEDQPIRESEESLATLLL
jgi:hypothetical protein